MKRILTVLVVLAVFVVGIGFYRGWFALSSPSPPAGSNDVNVNLTTDPDKMKEDAETVKEKAEELTEDAKDQFSPSADKPTDDGKSKQTPTADGKPAVRQAKPEQTKVD